MVAALSQQLTIRPMTNEDLDTVYSIECRAYQFPWTEGIFRDCLKHGYSCWIGEKGGDIVAYAVLSIAADEAHLLNIVVDPDSQQQGVGRHLLNWVTEIARDNGAHTVFLEVRVSNFVAYEMYLKEGFVQVGERKNYYKAENGREDAMVLALPLLDTFPVE